MTGPRLPNLNEARGSERDMNLTEVLLESKLVAIVRGISREEAVTAGQGMTDGAFA